MIITDETKLKQPCEEATPEEGIKILDQLAEELTKSPILGIGLAANQIGLNKRVCLLRFPENDSQGYQYHVEIGLVNPVITELSEPVEFGNEGCLSFPGKVVKTLRFNRCKVVDALEPSGRVLEGLRAIVAQHETDHLNGLTMYDSLLEEIKPNDRCRCGSGKKFKACCRLLLRAK